MSTITRPRVRAIVKRVIANLRGGPPRWTPDRILVKYWLNKGWAHRPHGLGYDNPRARRTLANALNDAFRDYGLRLTATDVRDAETVGDLMFTIWTKISE